MRRLARGAAGAVLASASASASAAAALVVAPPLDRVTPLVGEVVVRGELRSSLDGSTFDAVTQRDQFPHLVGEPAPRLGGLFDPGAGGMRVVEQDPATHVYRLAPTGAAGPACEAAGVGSPCLVPRLAALAHERLVTAEAFGATLGGRIEAEALAPPAVSAGAASALGWLSAAAALLGAAALARYVRHARRASAIGQVRAAAAEARRALRATPRWRARERRSSRCWRAPRSSTARAAPAPLAWRVSSRRGSRVGARPGPARRRPTRRWRWPRSTPRRRRQTR
jgi:hypothetical protein